MDRESVHQGVGSTLLVLGAGSSLWYFSAADRSALGPGREVAWRCLGIPSCSFSPRSVYQVCYPTHSCGCRLQQHRPEAVSWYALGRCSPSYVEKKELLNLHHHVRLLDEVSWWNQKTNAVKERNEAAVDSLDDDTRCAIWKGQPADRFPLHHSVSPAPAQARPLPSWRAVLAATSTLYPTFSSSSRSQRTQDGLASAPFGQERACRAPIMTRQRGLDTRWL